jgi:hypothetical protein
VYLASPNLLFFSYQFSYESLALPLAAVGVLAAVSAADAADRARRLAWTIVAVLLLAAVVASHHLTSYAVAAVLAGLLVASAALRRPRWRYGALAACAAASAAAWTFIVAPKTPAYLADIFGRAAEGVRSTAGGTISSRPLFESTSGGGAPGWERVVAVGATGLTTILIVLALAAAWRMRRRHPLVPVLALLAVVYPATLLLRLVASAWETGNRASTFLFVGVAWMVALAVLTVVRPRAPRAVAALVVPAVFAAILVGGVLSSWTPSTRLSQPFRVELGGRTTEPQAWEAARWSLTGLGPGNTIAAPAADARPLLTEGRQDARTGSALGINAMLGSPELARGEREIIRSSDLDYALLDRRVIAFDNSAGYFFGIVGARSATSRLRLDRAVNERLDVPAVDRLYDSGDVTIYDLRRLSP